MFYKSNMKNQKYIDYFLFSDFFLVPFFLFVDNVDVVVLIVSPDSVESVDSLSRSFDDASLFLPMAKIVLLSFVSKQKDDFFLCLSLTILYVFLGVFGVFFLAPPVSDIPIVLLFEVKSNCTGSIFISVSAVTVLSFMQRFWAALAMGGFGNGRIVLLDRRLRIIWGGNGLLMQRFMV